MWLIKNSIKKKLGYTYPLVEHVIINHDYKYIFIHIPKNAGTSIAKAIGIKPYMHLPALHVKQIVPKKIFNSYFKFCFVRNPYDRFLSLYNYARLEKSMYHSATENKHRDYDLLKNASLLECAQYLSEKKLKHDHFQNVWQAQTTWIRDKNNENLVDFIGRFEDLETDIQKVKSILGISGHQLEHLNSSSKKRNYHSFYNIETQKLIEKYYQEDLIVLDYTF